MKMPSNNVTSNQESINDKLEDVVTRYSVNNFKKPIPEFSRDVFEQIKTWSNESKLKDIVLDMGCGVGESTFELGKAYPDCLVVGIDKSDDRIKRNNHFKKVLPSNVKIFRADAIDIWRLFYIHRNDFNIIKQYILYPNPWPLKHHYKKRWHGHPVFPFIIGIGSSIEVRSNWKLYLDEFAFVLDKSIHELPLVQSFIPKNIMTPFERKFSNSAQELFRLIYTPKC